jgi:hypothetical protein
MGFSSTPPPYDVTGSGWAVNEKPDGPSSAQPLINVIIYCILINEWKITQERRGCSSFIAAENTDLAGVAE